MQRENNEPLLEALVMGLIKKVDDANTNIVKLGEDIGFVRKDLNKMNLLENRVSLQEKKINTIETHWKSFVFFMSCLASLAALVIAFMSHFIKI